MKNFVFGIGAQKAGTTWLHDYVSASPLYREGPVRRKEMHVWDAKEIPAQMPIRKGFLGIRSRSDYYVWRMRGNEDFYFDYFARLLDGGGVAADITPSYSGLSAETFAAIYGGIVSRGMTFRGIHIMRDPIARCISGFGMNRVRALAGGQTESVQDTPDLDAAFLDYITSEHCRFRTQYDVTLANAASAFPEECFLSTLFEEMFEPATLAAISGFIGIESAPDLANKKSNTAKERFEIGEEALAECARFYADTYAAVAQTHPSSKELWKGWRFL